MVLSWKLDPLEKEVHVRIAGLIHPGGDCACLRICDIALVAVEIDDVCCCIHVGRIVLRIRVAGGIRERGVVTESQEHQVCDHIGGCFFDDVSGENRAGGNADGGQFFSDETRIIAPLQIATGAGVHSVMTGVKLIGGERKRFGGTDLCAFGHGPSVVTDAVVR